MGRSKYNRHTVRSICSLYHHILKVYNLLLGYFDLLKPDTDKHKRGDGPNPGEDCLCLLRCKRNDGLIAWTQKEWHEDNNIGSAISRTRPPSLPSVQAYTFVTIIPVMRNRISGAPTQAFNITITYDARGLR
ncbi:hypothetical protein PGT21_004424 [Puccinia graminis f. sp. tritici]|nr:hypothetical protein PGT21_004424 [Puccinia graminis f. sp. tritici]